MPAWKLSEEGEHNNCEAMSDAESTDIYWQEK
jgi:hypothetical protein